MGDWFGEFCSWCCLPLLPQLARKILMTMGPLFGSALHHTASGALKQQHGYYLPINNTERGRREPFSISQKRRQTYIPTIPSRIMITARCSVCGSGGLNLAAWRGESSYHFDLQSCIKCGSQNACRPPSLPSRMREEFFSRIMSDCAPDRFFFIASSKFCSLLFFGC